MSPIGSTASVNQSDHGRVENEGLDSQPEPSESEADNNEAHQGQFPSPPRTPHRSLLQSIDPRFSPLLAARYSLLYTLNHGLNSAIAQIDLSQLAVIGAHLAKGTGNAHDSASSTTCARSSAEAQGSDGKELLLSLGTAACHTQLDDKQRHCAHYCALHLKHRSSWI